VAELDESPELQYGTQVVIAQGTQANQTWYLFDASSINTGPIVWGREQANAALLIGGAVTIGRDVNVLASGNTGASTLGGNTAHSSTFAGNVTLNRATTLTAVEGGTVNVTGNLTTNGHKVTKTGLGAVVVKNLRDGDVEVAEGTLAMAPDSSNAGVSNIDSVTVGAEARLDLRANKLVTSTPVGSWDGTKYTGIQGEVARAYDFGAWDLPGIMTSEPDAGPTVGKATIGVATGAQALFLGADETGVFGGQTINGTTTIAMYTWAGDVDLNGYVDAVDYGTIDQWIQFPGTTGYTNGDLNYDGLIDAVDYGIIDNGIQLQGAPIPVNGAGAGGSLSGVAAVPEPSAFGLAIFAGAALFRRRRRRAAAGR
jgi:hypothetical protein